MINILVAIRIWIRSLRGKAVLIHCDNMAVVSALNSGRGRDRFLLSVARNIWLLAAENDIEINFVHIMGKRNVTSDLLSRWNQTSHNYAKLEQHVKHPQWEKLYPNIAYLNLNI